MSSSPKNTIDIPLLKKNLDHLPTYMTEGAAGADIKASLAENSKVIIEPGQSALIPTGLFAAIPKGYEIQIRPRSVLAFKNQVTVLNTPATIDSDYRGEIKIILINHGKNSFEVTDGMRIAQLVIAPVIHANFILVKELEETKRGSGGFGHTG